jgi:Zn-dependent oligopeptidase
LEQALTAAPIPPAKPLSWSYTADKVTSLVDEEIKLYDELLDKIAALPKEERTYETVIRPMALHDSKVGWLTEPASFLKYVSTDEGIRNASTDGDKKLSVSGSTGS